MNIVFFGSSKFAVPSLKALLASKHKVLCVLTQPDKQKGRGLHFTGTAIKAVATESDIKVYQPRNVNDEEPVKLLKSLKPDLFVVIAYGQILSSNVLDIPRLLPINVHASLLPELRGAAPINWAIIRGDKLTGITVIKMTEKMDAGPVILRQEIKISDDDTAVTLEGALSDMAARLLMDSIGSIEDNSYNLMPQDESGVSFAPKLKKQDGQIDWNNPASGIYNLIRGCINWPGAYTHYKDKLLKIYKAGISSDACFAGPSLPGKILGISKKGITVATREGNLIIEELQIEGKRNMKAEEFIAGHKVLIGDMLLKK
ncbi:MAG: methionyl-tRNA formyltransferase [Candidatus Omnitrophica bacterium]|nr:methionyl-tRNA formyltransferase [Candidatus Omnitrophota bacterium]